MINKVKTPIYNGLRGVALAALYASKIVTGPWGWLAKAVVPKLMDLLIKPLFVKMRKAKDLKIFKKKSKKTTDAYENAKTKDAARNAFRNLP